MWGAILRREGFIYVKSTKVHAKRMTEEGTVDTVVDGKIEARRAYEKGDYLICGSRGGRYPMPEHQFSSRYSTTHPDPASDPALASAGFKLFKAKGKVGALALLAGPLLPALLTPVTGQVWSHTLAPGEVTEHFPSGRFIGKCQCRVIIGLRVSCDALHDFAAKMGLTVPRTA